MNTARFGLSVGHSSVFDCTLEDPTSTPWSRCPNVNPALKRLRCVIGELVETEKNYVQSLSDVDEVRLTKMWTFIIHSVVAFTPVSGLIACLPSLRSFREKILLTKMWWYDYVRGELGLVAPSSLGLSPTKSTPDCICNQTTHIVRAHTRTHVHTLSSTNA